MSKFESTVSFHNNVTHKRRAKNPSFSSILLDAIYHSIDEDHHQHGREYSRTTPASPTRSIVKQSHIDYCNNNNNNHNHLIEKTSSSSNKQRTRTKMRSDSTLETVDLRRAIMIDSWMEKQQHQNQPSPLLLPPHQQTQKKHHFHLGDVLDQKIRIVRQKSVPNRPTSSSYDNHNNNNNNNSFNDFSSCFTNLATRTNSRDQSSSRIFTNTKSRALKIYGDLKRSKTQSTPASPGRRFAAFLNSIFRNSGNSPSRSSPSPETKVSTPTTATTITSNSTCSSASSFSRSCLSKTTTSSSKSTPGMKRSVRFFPVSVIVDEDSRPCGHISLHNKNENEDSKKLENINAEYKWSKEKDIDVLTMVKTNCSNNQRHHDFSRFHEDLNDDDEDMEEQEEHDDDEDDDGESCVSSDLFELENFSSIGVSRYNEELPVYGTTSMKNVVTA